MSCRREWTKSEVQLSNGSVSILQCSSKATCTDVSTTRLCNCNWRSVLCVRYITVVVIKYLLLSLYKYFDNNFMCICTEQWTGRIDVFSVRGVLWTREIRAHVYKPMQEGTTAFHYRICSPHKLCVIVVVKVISKRQNNWNIILTTVMTCEM